MPVTIGRRELLAALGGAAAAWPLALALLEHLLVDDSARKLDRCFDVAIEIVLLVPLSSDACVPLEWGIFLGQTRESSARPVDLQHPQITDCRAC